MKNLWMFKNKVGKNGNKFVDKIPSLVYLLLCSIGIMVLFYGTQANSEHGAPIYPRSNSKN